MAVIITILAFELRPPHGASLDAIRDQLPGLLVYILSFAFVGIYWNNHHHLLRVADRISGAVMWANLFLLFWLSLIPVLTEWVRDQYLQSLPAATYGAVALAAGIAYQLLAQTLIGANGRDSRLARAMGASAPLARRRASRRPRLRQPLDRLCDLCVGGADVVRPRSPLHPGLRPTEADRRSPPRRSPRPRRRRRPATTCGCGGSARRRSRGRGGLWRSRPARPGSPSRRRPAA